MASKSISFKLLAKQLQSEEALKRIIEKLPGHVYWKDKEGRYLGCNLQQAIDLNLNNCDEIVGKTDYDFSSKEQADTFRLIDQRVMEENKEIETEEIIIKKGKQAIVLSQKIPLHDSENNTIGVLGISIDITERKELENALKESTQRAESANQAKSEFLNNMRHDIRTPLSGIVGFSEILKAESNEARIKEYADNLIASSHALLNLMDEVLEAIRVSSGEIPILKRKFNLKETLEQVIALNKARASQKRLDLSFQWDSALSPYLIGDKIRIHRIALELVGNALNFTDVGSVTLSVHLAKKTDHQVIIKLMVIDSGMGIPKDKQQEIYVQFKRLTPSYQGIYKGAGLGLYVVKQFIDELGGEIYVDSEARQGSVFTCLIPFQVPLLDDSSGIEEHKIVKTEAPFLTPISQEDNLKSQTSNPSILVVEDNIIAQTAAKTLLNGMNCTVDVADNGEKAIELFEQNNYDLIFMDIGLGEGLNGYDVTHNIRSHGKSTKHIPIIALTAHAADEGKERCIKAGMDAVLIKPLTHVHATDILQNFIPQRKVLSENKLVPVRRDLPDSDDELFNLNQFSLFDTDEALKNCGTVDMLKQLLLLMSKDLPKDLKDMKQAFTNDDYSKVEKLAHKIKGGAVYIGTSRMKYACQYVERYWKTGQRELFEALYNQAVNTIEETLLYIEGWLKK